jgi:hypothetical protein
MNVQLIPVKIKQRLNKLSSNDYDNIECWQFVEAFNKAQRDWVRRQLHGGNQYREGDEQSTRRIDDLQILLEDKLLSVDKKGIFYETETLPENYLQYKRMHITASKEKCKKKFSSSLIEEGNVGSYLADWTLKPSFEWEDTFHTFKGNRANIYSNNEFRIKEALLVYYRQPRDISLDGCLSIDGVDTGDVNPEFKDDIVEVIIDEAVSILAMDIESPNAGIISTNRVTKNN